MIRTIDAWSAGYKAAKAGEPAVSPAYTAAYLSAAWAEGYHRWVIEDAANSKPRTPIINKREEITIPVNRLFMLIDAGVYAECYKSLVSMRAQYPTYRDDELLMAMWCGQVMERKSQGR